MTKTILSIFILALSTNIFAYTPTLDSLLRNGNNSEIGNNSVVANLYIKEIKEGVIDKELINNSVVKFVVFNENEDRPKLLQVDYAGGKVSSNLVIDYKVRDFSRLSKIANNNEKIETQVFYSLMSSLLNNNSRHFLELFTKNNIEVKRNVELLNTDKVSLLGKYRNYLKTLKESDDIPVDLENPLKPTELEDKEKVAEILKQSFLKKDILVKRIKEHNEFYWVVESENLYLKFDKDHRLKMLRLITDMGNIEVICGRFVILGSQLEFPEFIWFKGLSGRKFEITVRSLKFFKDSKENHNKRLKKYNKLKEENNISENENKPSFLL
jgi:hypothetical protein